MNVFEHLLIDRLALCFDIRHLAAHHAVDGARGAGNFGGTEIYGVIDDGFETSSIPDGIWNALEHRRDGTLPESLYEFYAPGDGEAVCLDLSAPGEEAQVVGTWPGAQAKPEILFDDFGAWLLHAVEDELGAAGEAGEAP